MSRDYRKDPSYEDVFWDEHHGKGRWAGSCMGSSYGDSDWTYRIEFEDGTTGDYYLKWLKRIYDSRIRVGDMIDLRSEAEGLRLRLTVREIKPKEDRPYRVERDGASIWMSAHEFERFVRADAPERAAESLELVKMRITLLETELKALKLTEEVLEGVYV